MTTSIARISAVIVLCILSAFAGVVMANYEMESLLNKAIHEACPVPMEDNAYNACVVGVLEGK
jgi:hypothetical protein